MARRRSQRTGSIDGTSKLFCHCQQPIEEEDTRKFIACEICDNWYHTDCVGIESSKVSAIPKFMCRNCQKEGFLGNAGDDWFVEGLEQTQDGAVPAESGRGSNFKRAASSALPHSSRRHRPQGSSGTAGGGPASKPIAATAQTKVRETVRAKLENALRPAFICIDSMKSGVENVALEVEAALLALCGGTGVDYKTKARALIYNLGDVLNEKLRQNIASGSIRPEELVCMTPDQLANEQAQAQRAVIEAEKMHHSQAHKSTTAQATMDQDGTVRWLAMQEDEEEQADEELSPPMPAFSPMKLASASSQPATEAATPASTISGLQAKEQAILAAIAALPPEQIAGLPSSLREQYADLCRA